MNARVLAVFLSLWLPPALAADVAAVLQWSQRVELSIPVSGVVRTVEVAPAERVKKGQPLVRLDDTVYRARVAEASAAAERFREELAEAKRNLDRTQELYDRAVIATNELDQARLGHARALSRMKEAQARQRQEAKNLEDTVLRAPFDAVVVADMVQPGMAVASGLQPQPLLALAKAGEMVARASLAESQIGRFKVGEAVTVTVGGQSYPGKIRALGLEPVAAKDGAVYQADIVFQPKTVLRAGKAATVNLP